MLRRHFPNGRELLALDIARKRRILKKKRKRNTRKAVLEKKNQEKGHYNL